MVGVLSLLAYEDECVGCPDEFNCFGYLCQYRKIPHLYCDECKEEVDCLYNYNGEEICQECLIEKFEKITI